MPFLSGGEFMRLPNEKTTQKKAWKDGYFETYRINVALHAVQVHPKEPNIRMGHWFGVDTYNYTVDKYTKSMALINATQTADSYVLRPGGVYNVGIAARQGTRPGDGWQFEYIDGSPAPVHDEHVTGLRATSRVPL
jgi:hypothetical protein